MVYKKIIKNKWKYLCMLIGFIVSAAMLSSIPLYTEGVTQKLLTKDMEKYQIDNSKVPASFSLRIPLSSYTGNYASQFEKINKSVINSEGNVNLPVTVDNNKFIADFFTIDHSFDTGKDGIKLTVLASKSLKDHITVTNGKLFSGKKESDGSIDVIATEQAMQEFGLTLNSKYTINYNCDSGVKSYVVTVVGQFKNKYSNDSFFDNGFGEYNNSLVMDYQLFKKELLNSEAAPFVDTQWYRAYDYHKITTENIGDILYNMKELKKWGNKVAYGADIAGIDVLINYYSRQKSLKLVLLVLEMPIILMLVFYLFMVSEMLVEQDKKEIAVLKSRGAGRGYIVLSYFVQGLMLALAAMILGPPIGLFTCTILGSTNGFMEFVQRTSLPLKMNLQAYLYALMACLVFILTMLIPAFWASKTTIVKQRGENIRVNKKPLFQRYYLDFVLFAVACYGYYNYKAQKKILNITGVSGTDIPISPFLYIIISVFIFGLGLIFIRLFPYIIKLIFKLGKNHWKISTYSSLINLSRSGGKNNFLVMFLIITVATGIFSANAARTINTNLEQKDKYSIGADITIQAKWENNRTEDLAQAASGGQAQGQDSQSSDAASDTSSIQQDLYTEPDFESYASLSGVEMATKVLKMSDLSFSDLGQSQDVKIDPFQAKRADKDVSNTVKQSGDEATNYMAIIPSEFGKIAWFRTNLLKYHWYYYLNLLTKYPNGVLVSSSMAKNNGVKLGDELTVDNGDGNTITGTVVGVVDYWPGYNPYPTKGSNVSKNLVVGNLYYYQNMMTMKPYEVWIKKKKSATSAQIYKDIKNKKLEVESLQDTSQSIIADKNDPIIEGTNGVLSLGFIVDLLVTLIGFVIFWILVIKGRTFQFGILRAMGISLKEVIHMIFSELIILSGASIVVGAVIGFISSKLFVPLLEITGGSSQYVPPFEVTQFLGDYFKIFAVLLIIIGIGVGVLYYMISKININQALKLGED